MVVIGWYEAAARHGSPGGCGEDREEADGESEEGVAVVGAMGGCVMGGVTLFLLIGRS